MDKETIPDLTSLGDVLHIRVTPKASSNRIKVEPQPDGSTHFRVYVTTVPEDGKANKAVIALLSKYLGIPKTSMTITHGTTGKDKTIKISR
jgi:hypothetical protein